MDHHINRISTMAQYGNGKLMEAYLKKMKEIENNKYNQLPTNMKPTYHSNTELNCGISRCNGNDYLMDHADKDSILNFQKKFYLYSPTDIYPSYGENGKRISYLEFIFKFNTEQNTYQFKNGNPRDMRRSNVMVYPKYAETLLHKYTVLEYLGGHCKHIGIDAGVIKNPTWRVTDETGEHIVMYCHPGVMVTLCYESMNKILDFETEYNEGEHITWYIHSNNYVQGRIGKLRDHLFIHQVIMKCYGNGKGTGYISVDHIDRDTLNNRLNNLRIATREEQQNNSRGIAPGTLRERSSKKEFPEGITPDMLHKFVYYNHEVYNKAENKTREFFRVEHPKLDKPWCTTKSGKVSIQEKLAQANKVSDDLDNDIFPQNISKSITITTVKPEEVGGGGAGGVGVTKTIMEDVNRPLKEGKEKVVLPKYISFIISRDKPHLVFEKRVDGVRMGIKMVLPTAVYVMQEQLEKLNKKIIDKYGEEHKVI